jgi:hypothetical protein
MKAFETLLGKKIELYIDKKTALIRLKFSPGGELPEELTGLYKSERDAEKDIVFYLDRVKDKKTKIKVNA